MNQGECIIWGLVNKSLGPWPSGAGAREPGWPGVQTSLLRNLLYHPPPKASVGLSSFLSVHLLVSKPPLLDFGAQGTVICFSLPLLLGTAVQGSSEGYRLRDCPQGSNSRGWSMCPSAACPLFFTQPTLAPSSCVPAEPPGTACTPKEAPRTLNSSLLQTLVVAWQGLGLPGETPLVLALIWM